MGAEMTLPARPVHMAAAVYDKIVADTEISVDLKTAIINACVPATSEDEASALFDAFASGNVLNGRTVALNDDEIVGHVKNLSNTALYLSKKLSVDRTDVESILRHLAGHGTRTQLEYAMAWFRDEILGHTEDLKIAQRPTWLFRDPSGDARSALAAPVARCLPCRLGLPALMFNNPIPAGIEYVGYCADSAAVSDARLPTCLDGSYQSVKDIWAVGGSSVPIPHGSVDCVSQGGFREIVADAPSFRHIRQEFSVFET